METDASQPDDKIAAERHQKYLVMTVSNAARNTLVGQVHKCDVRQGIDNLGGIDRQIVILRWYKLARSIKMQKRTN